MRSLRSAAAALLALALVAALGSSTAGAQTVAPYQATPPTKGALASDGPTQRYLLGGTWLYRPDYSNVGLAEGWSRPVASTAGWSPVTIPNSYNAGDFSSASMAGWVGWYRRDFTLPSHAFAKYVPKADQNWIVQFESVDYRATVWLNGHQLGSHVGAYLPFEFALKYLRAGVNRMIVRVDNRRTQGRPPTVQQPVVELRRDRRRGLPAAGGARQPRLGAAFAPSCRVRPAPRRSTSRPRCRT